MYSLMDFDKILKGFYTLNGWWRQVYPATDAYALRYPVESLRGYFFFFRVLFFGSGTIFLGGY